MGICSTTESLGDDNSAGEQALLNFTDMLLKNVDCVPLQCLKTAIKHGKLTLMTRILSHLSFIVDNQYLCKTADVKPNMSRNQEESLPLLNVALQSNNQIVKLLLDFTNIDVL